MDVIPYKSFEEQIEKIKNKNIHFEEQESETVIARVKNHSYYSLINGYKEFFLVNGESDWMLDGTRFNHFYVCKNIEMDFSSIMLKYTQIVEQGFRNRVAHIIAREFTTDDQVYLLEDNYSNHYKKRKTLAKMREIRDSPHNNSYSYYFKNDKNASIPPWILLQDLDFYYVISLYQCLNEDLRMEIRKDYITIDTSYSHENREFANSMHFIREYRNIFAHSKRNFKEKISYSLKYKFYNQCSFNNIMVQSDFDSRRKSKSLLACIVLVMSYMNDDFLKKRLFTDIYKMFLEDDYVDKDLKGRVLFNTKTIYDFLGLPDNFILLLAEKSISTK